MQTILLDHVLPMSFESGELATMDVARLENVNGGMIELDIDGDALMFSLGNNTVTVTEADLNGCAMTDEGESVIHRIDGILADLPDAAAVAPATDIGDRGADLGDLGTEEEGSAPFMTVVAPAVCTAVAAAMMLL